MDATTIDRAMARAKPASPEALYRPQAGAVGANHAQVGKARERADDLEFAFVVAAAMEEGGSRRPSTPTPRSARSLVQAFHHVVATMCLRRDSGKRWKLRLSWVSTSTHPASLGSLIDRRSIREEMSLGAQAISARS